MSNIILRSVTSLPDAPVGYKFILNDGGVLKQKELSVISGFKGGLPYKVISGTFIKQTNGLAVVTITTNTWGSYSIQQLPGPGTRGVPASSQYRFLLGSPQNKTICFVIKSDVFSFGIFNNVFFFLLRIPMNNTNPTNMTPITKGMLIEMPNT